MLNLTQKTYHNYISTLNIVGGLFSQYALIVIQGLIIRGIDKTESFPVLNELFLNFDRFTKKSVLTTHIMNNRCPMNRVVYNEYYEHDNTRREISFDIDPLIIPRLKGEDDELVLKMIVPVCNDKKFPKRQLAYNYTLYLNEKNELKFFKVKDSEQVVDCNNIPIIPKISKMFNWTNN